MLMDEPFSAVDPVVRAQLQDEFLRLQGELRKTIVFVTHDIDEAVALSKRVVVLSGRPARVKIVHDIEIDAASPIAARSDSRFSGYFHALCAELDIQTEKTA
jgi:NitT/TauT family transport system ATP-binding protein